MAPEMASQIVGGLSETLMAKSPSGNYHEFEEVGTKLDIFAFAITIACIFTDGVPYSMDGRPVEVDSVLLNWFLIQCFHSSSNNLHGEFIHVCRPMLRFGKSKEFVSF